MAAHPNEAVNTVFRLSENISMITSLHLRDEPVVKKKQLMRLPP